MLGTTLGKYRLLSKLGEGAMGVVYLAEHTLLGSHAAVKVLLSQHVGDPMVVQRFFNEARAASGIRHMGIVDIFDVGRTADGTSFIVMELLRGETLAQRLRRGGLTLTQVVSVVAQVASALAAAHKAKVVHRDLKPENIFLIDDRGAPAGLRVKLLDFGVAKLVGDAGSPMRTAVGMVLGTPHYMSPEQVRGDGAVDYRADLYALGCLMFRLLTGRPPFDGEIADVMRAHVLEPAPSMRSVDPRLPAELDQIVLALLAKDPMGRPRSANAVVEALGELGGGLLAPAMSTPTVPIAQGRRRPANTTLSAATGSRPSIPESPAPRRRRTLPVLAAIAVVAAAAGFGIWLGHRDVRDRDVVAARLPAPKHDPLATPAPIADDQIDAMLAAAPTPGPKHVAPVQARPLAMIRPMIRPCPTAARRRPAASAALRGRSPC